MHGRMRCGRARATSSAFKRAAVHAATSTDVYVHDVIIMHSPCECARARVWFCTSTTACCQTNGGNVSCLRIYLRQCEDAFYWLYQFSLCATTATTSYATAEPPNNADGFRMYFIDAGW